MPALPPTPMCLFFPGLIISLRLKGLRWFIIVAELVLRCAPQLIWRVMSIMVSLSLHMSILPAEDTYVSDHSHVPTKCHYERCYTAFHHHLKKKPDCIQMSESSWMLCFCIASAGLISPPWHCRVYFKLNIIVEDADESHAQQVLQEASSLLFCDGSIYTARCELVLMPKHP